MIGRVGRAGPAWAGIALLCACPEEPPPAAAQGPDSGLSSLIFTSNADEKAKLFPLVGRWYPVSEVKRLSDPTLTAREWCERPPMKVSVEPDQVTVVCKEGLPISAAVARVMSSTVTASELVIQFRAAKDSPLRRLAFRDRHGPSATIDGSPCFDGEPEPHTRFPEYEILTRQILGGRRCAQILESASAR